VNFKENNSSNNNANESRDERHIEETHRGVSGTLVLILGFDGRMLGETHSALLLGKSVPGSCGKSTSSFGQKV